MVARIRVLLVDDHNLVRAGIRVLLERFSDIEIVGEASNGQQALDLIETHRPDLVLADIAMPILSGLELTHRIAETFPEIRVLILSMYAHESYVHATLRGGAAGYLLKDAAREELLTAIRTVAQGETYLSSQISALLLKDDVVGERLEERPLDRLSSRQLQVLKLIAEGLTTKQIALALNISIKTVETHRARLMERLDIYEVASLVRFAIRSGLIKLDEL